VETQEKNWEAARQLLLLYNILKYHIFYKKGKKGKSQIFEHNPIKYHKIIRKNLHTFLEKKK